MAYQLKTTGIATLLRHCFIADPDVDDVRDYANSSVDSTLVVGSGVTFGSQDWEGITRKYWLNGAANDATSFAYAVTNLPTWRLCDTGQSATLVMICESGPTTADTPRAFGTDNSNAFAALNLGTGTGFPTMRRNGEAVTAGLADPAASKKEYFGYSYTAGPGGFAKAYTSTTNADTVTTESASWGAPSPLATVLSFSKLGGTDSTFSHERTKIHAILIFDGALTKAEHDSLFSDWFGTLLETAGPTGFTLTSDQGSFSLTGQAATLKTARKIFADFGAYSLTGQAATLQKDSPGAFTLTAAFGSYSWNGSDALADYAINAEYGVYNLSGQAATLTRFQPGSYSLTADFGSYALLGQVATFSRTLPQNYSLAANQGSYNFTGRAARLDWSGAPVVPSSGTGLYSGMRIGL